jgi:hypothetical protein
MDRRLSSLDTPFSQYPSHDIGQLLVADQILPPGP